MKKMVLVISFLGVAAFAQQTPTKIKIISPTSILSRPTMAGSDCSNESPDCVVPKIKAAADSTAAFRILEELYLKADSPAQLTDFDDFTDFHDGPTMGCLSATPATGGMPAYGPFLTPQPVIYRYAGKVGLVGFNTILRQKRAEVQVEQISTSATDLREYISEPFDDIRSSAFPQEYLYRRIGNKAIVYRGTIGNQPLEYFYCWKLPANVPVFKEEKSTASVTVTKLATVPVGSVLLDPGYIYTSGLPNPPRPVMEIANQILTTKILGNAMYVRAMAADSQFIYVAVDDDQYEKTPAKIIRINRESRKIEVLATDERATNLVIMRDRLFWADIVGIKSMSLKNPSDIKQFISGAQCACDLATDGSNIYWSDVVEYGPGNYASVIKKKSADGKTTVLVEGIRNMAYSIVTDGNSVYWTTWQPDEGPTRAYKVSVNGGNPIRIAPEYSLGQVFAVDSDSVYYGGSDGLYRVTPK